MRAVGVIGLLGAVAFVAAHPPMWGYGEQWAFPGWDLTRVFWADLAYARRAVAAGELPLWNPFDRAGYPFMAEPQSGMFDPLTWLLVSMAVLIGSAPAWLIVLKSVASYAIGASGMAAFLRGRRLPTWAVSAGALAFVLCPRLDKLKDQSALWPTAWIGWLLLAVDRCARQPTPRRGVWLGAAAGMMVVSGYPPTAFRLALLAVPYGIAIVVARLRDANDRRAYLRALAIAGAVAAVVTLVLAAGQVVATAQALPATKRAAIDVSHIVASRTHLHHAAGAVAPFSETSPLLVYAGFACALGVLASLWRARAEDVTLLVCGAVGFVLACGENAPLLPALADLPGFSAFRIAGHYLTLPAVTLCVLGPIGLARLAERSRLSPRWPPWTAAAVGVVAFFGLSPTYGLRPVLVVLMTAALGLLIAFGPTVWRPRAGWGLVAVLVIDLFGAARPVAKILQPLPKTGPGEVMVEALGRSEVFRIADFGWAGHRVGPREGVRDFVGHRPALTDRRYMMLYGAASDWASLLRASNVAVAGFRDRTRAIRGGRLDRVRGHRRLYRVEDPWPMAFWTRDIAVVSSPEFSLAWMQARQQPGAAVEEATIDPETADRLRSVAEVSAEPIAPRLLEQGLHRLVFEVDAPNDGVLVIVEGFDAGWTATVDDEPAEVMRANLIFRAVEVPAGSHRVVLSYAPPGVRALWWLWLVAMIGLGVFAVDELRRGRKQVHTGSSDADEETP